MSSGHLPISLDLPAADAVGVRGGQEAAEARAKPGCMAAGPHMGLGLAKQHTCLAAACADPAVPEKLQHALQDCWGLDPSELSEAGQHVDAALTDLLRGSAAAPPGGSVAPALLMSHQPVSLATAVDSGGSL